MSELDSQREVSRTQKDEAISLADRLAKEHDILRTIWQELRLSLCNSGLESDLNLIPLPDLAEYSIQTDPFDKSESLLGVWRDKHGCKQGEIQIREDGRIYAEVDVIRNHPTDVRWFIESVTAWGSKESIKTELRLLPAI
jgi:hypothetical protein